MSSQACAKLRSTCIDANPFLKDISMLLTPIDVAKLLQISVRTVYDNKSRLGGFYPAGIKVLRFRQEVIDGILRGQGSGALEVPIRAQGQKLYRQEPQSTPSDRNRLRRPPKGTLKDPAAVNFALSGYFFKGYF